MNIFLICVNNITSICSIGVRVYLQIRAELRLETHVGHVNIMIQKYDFIYISQLIFIYTHMVLSLLKSSQPSGAVC